MPEACHHKSEYLVGGVFCHTELVPNQFFVNSSSAYDRERRWLVSSSQHLVTSMKAYEKQTFHSMYWKNDCLKKMTGLPDLLEKKYYVSAIEWMSLRAQPAAVYWDCSRGSHELEWSIPKNILFMEFLQAPIFVNR